MLDTTTLNRGDKIAFNTSNSHFSACFIRFSEVEKVTPSGQVIATNGMKFNNSGKQMKTATDNFPTASLIEVGYAEEVIKIAKIQGLVNSTVRELESKLAGHRTGRGDYHLNEEQSNLAQQLIASLSK